MDIEQPKKIIISYWHLSKYKDLPYKHKSEYEYNEKLIKTIITFILSKGYYVMIAPPIENNIIIWIDKGRFNQS